jgi:formiminotetrahydrofolate cyclodeaminase
VSESLWSAGADELLRRTASADPTPGGGSIAAVSGAFGLALVRMALVITDDADLSDRVERLDALLAHVTQAADDDVAVFEVVVAAYRSPRGDDAEREARTAAIAHAMASATELPLDLCDALLEGVEIADAVESRVRPMIVSDVQAGRDLLLGAVRAAMRTVDGNLGSLRDPDAIAALGTRRDRIARILEAR